MRCDNQTIYQIHFQAHRGYPKKQIASTLGLSRNTVIAHLSGRHRWQYDRGLKRRIDQLTIPPIKYHETPKGYITIAESSYFFERRPTPKSILHRYDLQVEIINGVNYSTVEWARNCAEKSNVAKLEGVCMKRDAARYLYGVQSERPIVSLMSIDSSDTPANLVHIAVGIMAWTGLGFVTLNSEDVMRFADSSSF